MIGSTHHIQIKQPVLDSVDRIDTLSLKKLNHLAALLLSISRIRCGMRAPHCLGVEYASNILNTSNLRCTLNPRLYALRACTVVHFNINIIITTD